MQISQRPIVIDFGQSMVRCGFAGDNKPKSAFPSVTGIPIYPSYNGVKYYAGEQAMKKRAVLKLKHPINQGEIQCLEGITQILSHCYDEQLEISSENQPIFYLYIVLCLLFLAPKTNYQTKYQLIERIFEKFNPTKLCLINPTILTMYASNKGIGLFVTCGEAFTQTLSQKSSLQNLGGKDLTLYMKTLLSQKHPSFGSSARQFYIAKKYKQAESYIALYYQKQLEQAQNNNEQITYELDNDTMHLIGSQTFKCPQALFNPAMMGKKVPSLPQIIYEAICKCDQHIRPSLFQNIVISGGLTTIPCFLQRLRKQVGLLASKNVNITDFADKKHFTWKGASIATDMIENGNLWITRQQFQQLGPSVVSKCC